MARPCDFLNKNVKIEKGFQNFVKYKEISKNKKNFI